ncbi:putative antiholin [Campylobacter phage F341]|uniref:Putative antiholin n=1 Tax=Campylobacter phage F372 TaxID=2794375 RepID=A0A7T3KIJ7_9CAUD|nr:putative antiholin [Campylobacter phage F372]WJZ70133.1 putative antiholin [Campylobacter phage F341]
MKSFSDKIKYYFFIFRWFLIGKYHCDIPQRYKKYYKISHRILWLNILFCVIYTWCGLIGLK